MKPALLSRFVRSSRHVRAEPCRNCSHVYFGNYCNECGQEAYTGAPTTLGFIYEFLTRNLLERGKVHRTLWQLVRHPGSLTVDFLEGRRQRFIRPVRLYFILSVMYFLLLSVQNSNMMKYFGTPAPVAPAVAESTAPTNKPILVLGGMPVNRPVGAARVGDGESAQFANFRYDAAWSQYTAWLTLKERIREFDKLSNEQSNVELNRMALDQAPKAMFFLVPVFALFLKGLLALRRIPYGAHLLFAFHFHCYVFLMLLLTQLPLPQLFKVVAAFSVPWYLFNVLNQYRQFFTR